MSILRRKEVGLIIMAVCLLIGLGAHFTTYTALKSTSSTFKAWVTCMTAMMAGLGAINIGKIHGKHIMSKKIGQWYLSIILVVMIIVTVFIGVYFPGGVSNAKYQLWYMTFFTPNDTMILAMVGWLLVPAIFRAFRIRNLESTILLLSGVIVMLMNVPIGEAMWSGFPILGQWISSIPNVAGQRAFIMVVAIGIIILTLRTVLGYEKGALSAGE